MASATDICNLALGQLGADRITNFENPETPNEQLCNLYYPIMRSALLEERDWTFITKRAKLTIVDSLPPEWGYAYAFTLPSDVARVIDVRDNAKDNAPSTFEWRMEGGKIICDAKIIYVRYIISDVSEDKFSPMFTVALAARLAAEMCMQVTENNGLFSTLWNVFSNKIQEAKVSDQMQGKSQLKRSTNLLRVR